MFQNIPLSTIATWPAPSPDPVNKVSTVLAAEITMSVILTLVVGLRFVSRIWVTRAIHLDDWLTIPAYIFTMAFNLITMISTHYGWGYHIWDIPIEHWVPLLKLTYSYTPVFVGANFCTKLSILFFYRRIFSADHKFLRLVNCSIIFVVLWNIAFFWLGVFVCTPLRAYWDLSPIAGQRCYDVVGFEVYGGMDVAVDLYLMLMFQWKIWNMKLPLSKKISIAFIMSFAGLAVGATVMRIPFILRACLHVDKSWDGMELTLWSSAELVLGILCASAPSIRAFFTKKNRHILVGRLHSMPEWLSHGASRHVATNVDAEAGNATWASVTSEGTATVETKTARKEKAHHELFDSIGSTVSASSGNTKIGSVGSAKDIPSPGSWNIEESPWGPNMSLPKKE